MLKTECEIYHGRGFGCPAKDDQCINTRECANHVTAGDFRSECGTLPVIRFLDIEAKTLICESNTTHYYELSQGEMLTIDDVNTTQLVMDL